MIVRHLDELRGTDREVEAPTWVSRRFLLSKDGLGFSMHDTTLHAGTETEMEYKHHLEAVYCIGGEGEIQVLPDARTASCAWCACSTRPARAARSTARTAPTRS